MGRTETYGPLYARGDVRPYYVRPFLAAVDNECLATLRHFLVEMQGLDPTAADVIVRRIWAPSSQSGLNCVWKLWLQHCNSAGISFSSPNVAEFINFLQHVSDGTYRTGANQRVPTSVG
jgi:hypothetical protein